MRGKMLGFAIVLGFATGNAMAQQNQPGQQQQQQPNAQSAYNAAQNQQRASMNFDSQAYRTANGYWIDSMRSLPKLHASLAAEWQRLGMSAQGAQVVASAYNPGQVTLTHHKTLKGKSDAEVASMLQSALAKKDYMLADQLLIDYERERLKLGAVAIEKRD